MQRYRHFFSRKNLMIIGMPSATAAFYIWTQGNSGNTRWKDPLEKFHKSPFKSNKWSTNPDRVHALSVEFSSINEDRDRDDKNKNFTRAFRTPADEFFKENKKIPLPLIVHATLAELSALATIKQEENNPDENKTQKNILVIGDVHGCYDELLELHAKAVKENDSTQFQYVILVGDLW